ncbi:hypothetical protein KEM60_01242 [Austwickia sp. TVS 96-490-7B]|uniref:hypothetical protein n=1 Tax=Austwickia sp. TVS 96-490-7B TaxID=2830843 RepID=UPI001C5A59CD|nr:hypothetical protein [Austwickia sp. TVS 96-490-7B]MBW3085050.1 hypothetical protein [Austwickia sp. TVS 96-490-7B]
MSFRSETWRRPRTETLGVAVTAALLVSWAIWRIRYGASFHDDGHVIAQAWRLSLGDQLFIDELNVQTLGAAPAVPFVRLWVSWHGLTGLVLACRVFFLTSAALAAAVCFMALRRRVGPAAALAGGVSGLLVLPYNLFQFSYNSSPVVALHVAIAAAAAGVWTGTRRWYVIAAASAAAACATFPNMLPSAVWLLGATAVIGRRHHAWRSLVVGGTVVGLPFLVWLLCVPGWGALQHTVDFTIAYQGDRLPLSTRLGNALSVYADLFHRRYLPMHLGVGLALVGALRPGWAVWRVAGTSVAVIALAAVHVLSAARGDAAAVFRGSMTATAMVLVVILVVPVCVDAWYRRDRAVGVLFVLAAPAAVIQVPLVAATTSSGPMRAVHGVGASMLVSALSVGWVRMVRDLAGPRHGWAKGLAGLVVILPLAAVGTWGVAAQPPVTTMTAHIDQGAWAGVWTDQGTKTAYDERLRLLRRWVTPGSRLMLIGSPGAYLIGDAIPATPILWMEEYGPANETTVQWLRTSGDAPQIVMVDRERLRSGSIQGDADRDPLMAYLSRSYRQVDADERILVLQRTDQVNR